MSAVILKEARYTEMHSKGGGWWWWGGGGGGGGGGAGDFPPSGN